MRVAHLSRAFLRGASLLALIGLALAGCGQISAGDGDGTATPSPATTCAQAPGFASAVALDLPSIEFPAGTVAQMPTVSGGAAGQYAVKTYLACAPNTDANLTVSTGKGPEPFATLAQSDGWVSWNMFPSGGDAQVACPGACFALNADNSATDVGKDLFVGTPGFMSLESVTSLGHGLVTFTLRVTTPPPAPDCDFSQPGGAPEIALWYEKSAGIQYPPLTFATGDETMSTDGFALCSAGTVASVKAFMDHQFSSHGYTSVTCASPDDDCWQSGATTVTMSFQSATQWFIFTPRVLPTP